MGKNHFPPPESSPRSNKPPRRLAPGNQRVEAKPLNHFNSPPNNKPTIRPPPDRFHGNHLNKTTADYRRHHPRDSNGYGQDHHVPIKYDQRDSVRKDPSSSEVRFKLPENFYTKEGPSFLDVMKKPVPVFPTRIRATAQSVLNRDVDQVVRKPIADAEFIRSTASSQSQFLNLDPNLNKLDRPDLPVVNDSILNLDLDQDQDLKIPEELPVVKESTGKENIWGSGSFVDVLKKPAPITLPQINDSEMVGNGMVKPPMEKPTSATNTRNRNGYQNQTQRYYERRDRGRKTGNLLKKPNRNRKEHHSRGEEILLDDSKKKIRTPEKVELPSADLPKSSDFIIGNANSDQKTVSNEAITPAFVDGIIYRRSFVDVVRKGPPPPPPR